MSILWPLIMDSLALTGHVTGSFARSDDPGEPGSHLPRLSITPAEGLVLAALAAGRSVFEIGTGLGVSARFMATTAYRIVTFDIDPWVHEQVWPRLSDQRNVTCVDWVPEGEQFDMVFIDGMHTTEAVLADIEIAQRLLKPGGMIVFHDTNLFSVLEAIRQSEVGSIFLRETTHGLGVVWPWAI